ncbi:unnamed protein product, partial [Vitis vinifera]
SQKELEKQPAYDYIRWTAYRSWVGYGAEEDFYKQTYLRYLGLSSSKHRCRMAIKGTDVDESKIHGH